MKKLFTTIVGLWLGMCSLQAQVEIYGSLREIMHGSDWSDRAKLNLLGPLTNKYGIGAVSGLDGEIIILDGQVFVSKEWDGKLVIEKSSDVGAVLLVMAEVDDWQQTEMSFDYELASFSNLENLIRSSAETLGMDVSKPFPFRLLASDVELKFHVITPEAGRSGNHKEDSYSANYDGTAEILGFYGPNHGGVFTHMDSKIHLHFLSEENNAAGHVDEIVIKSSFQLLLPKSF